MSDYREELFKLGINADKSGKYLCPVCSATRSNKSDKCLSVTFKSDGVVYKCHNCDFKGGVSYDNRYIPSVKRDYKRPEQPKLSNNKEYLYQYFEKRNISKDILERYNVGINNRKEIIFPYYKNSELVNIKYRTNLENDKKTFRQEADTEKTFYGMDLVTDFKQLVIVEGEIDVLSFAMAGIEAVSVPQGASENKLECIDNCYEWLQQFESYIIAVDNDEAGKKLKNTLLSRLDKFKCKTVYFDGYKDANEVLCTDNGKEQLLKVINNSEFIRLEGITDFSSHADKIFECYYNGYLKGYSTGWTNLDKIFTIKTGYLMIVTGIPSRGKSFVVDNMLYNLSEKYQLKHLICSFENNIENHFARLASMHKGKKFSSDNGMSPDEVKESLYFLNNYFLRLEIDRLWDVDQIIEQLEYAVKRYGVNTLTIDPYNRLNNPITEREDKYIGSILAKLSMAAKRLNVLIIFIAHPRKINKDEQYPTMYSISGSADWYNMADYGIIIHRDREQEGDRKLENKVRVIVQKVKDFHLGDPSGGEAFLEYYPERYKLFDYKETCGNWNKKAKQQ